VAAGVAAGVAGAVVGIVVGVAFDVGLGGGKLIGSFFPGAVAIRGSWPVSISGASTSRANARFSVPM
jgi:hypothetical protein